MKTAAMISISEENYLDQVYTPDTRKQLAQHLRFLPDATARQPLVAPGSPYAKVQVLFSTWGMPTFTEDELNRFFPKLEALFYGAGSVQAFAPALLACGVRIFSAAAANAVPVAEFTAAQILLANKGFFQSAALYRSNGFQAGRAFSQALSGNLGATIGILGAGAIGRLVLQALKAGQPNILVFDPFLPDADAEALGVKKAGLDEIFAGCQVISNHLANNAQTQGILQYRHFSLMPPNATFINTGRGAQVVEADLARALREEPTRFAVLDVTFPEPMRKDSPLWALPNVVVSPHIAGSMGNETWRMGEYMRDAFLLYRAGKPCPYEVTSGMLAAMA
jgi:phosphoglycerate dehydrogenase-like enzyme